MNRKSQVKMGETIAILIIFFFLVMMGFSFYTNVQEFLYKRQEKIDLNLDIIKLYQRASFMTEFQCTFKDISIDNCYDEYKVAAFEKIMNDLSDNDTREFYYNIFGQTKIMINLVYPKTQTYQIIDNSIDNATFIETVILPISIYDASTSIFSFGLLNITVYLKDVI